MVSVAAITFPENVEGISIGRRHPLLKHIALLSRRTISTVIIIYLVAKFLIQPQIELSFKYRFQLQNHVFRQLKSLNLRLQKMVKNPPKVNVSYNGRQLTDRTVITDDLQVSNSNEREVRFDNNREQRPIFEALHQRGQQSMDSLVSKLKSLKMSLEMLPVPQYNKWDGSMGIGGNNEMNSLLLQTKQFKSYLDIVTSEHPREMIFKRPVSHFEVGSSSYQYENNYLDILQGDLNEIRSLIH